MRKGAGATALASIERLTYSIIVGHTHRQAKTALTRHNIDDTEVTIYGVEAGTMAVVGGGLGYAVDPNWQQGFAVAYIHEDGDFDVQLAEYYDHKLHFGRESYGRG